MAQTTGGAGAAADQIARAHTRLLQDHSLQFAFASHPRPRPPDWLRPLAEVIKAIAPALQWVFWAGLAITLAAILFYIGRELIRTRWPKLRKTPVAAAPAADWRPEPSRALALLEDADRLAAEGRYAEAAHLLLHRSIDDIEGRRPRAVRPALTARDIAGLDALPATARAPFQTIAAAVERSFFGGRDVDAADFAECRRAYETFAFPEAWA
jgi:hypothetical protein